MAITPERYTELYTLARNWAEDEAALCQGAKMLPLWKPPVRGALALGAKGSEEIDLVLGIASISWSYLQSAWISD